LNPAYAGAYLRLGSAFYSQRRLVEAIASYRQSVSLMPANAEAFNRAVSEVSDSARRLLASLQTNAPARDREVEAEKARERSRARFG